MHSRIRFLLAALLLPGMACLTPPVTGTAAGNYARFVAAHKAGDHAAALRWLELAYRDPQRPAHVAYWYGALLLKAKRWADALPVLRTIPAAYQPVQTAWHLGECLLQLGRPAEARTALEQGLKVPDTADRWQLHLYIKLVEVLERQGDPAALQTLEPAAIAYVAPRSDDLADFLRYRFARLYLDRASREAESGTWAAGELWFRAGLAAAKRKTGKYARYLSPENFVTIWHKRRDMARALAAYGSLPEGHRRAWQRFIAVDAALVLGRTNEALASAERELPRIDDPAIRRYVYHRLVRLLVDLGDLDRLAAHESAFLAAFAGQKDDYAGWLRLRITQLALFGASRALDRGEGRTALILLERTRQIRAAGFGKYADQAADFEEWTAACRRWADRAAGGLKTVTVELCVLVFPRLVGTWTNSSNVVLPMDNRLGPQELARYEAEFGAFRKMLYHLTDGRLVVRARLLLLPYVLTAVRPAVWQSPLLDAAGARAQYKYHAPVLASARPPVGPVFFTNRNLYDGFVTVFPSQGITSTCTGGYGYPEYVPGRLRAGAPRLMITMAGTAMGSGLNAARVLVHEFFHNVEGLYRDRHRFLAHVYGEGYRAHWPAWFRGGGELAYYRSAFSQVIGPAGLGRLRTRHTPDPVTEERYRRALSAGQGP